MIHRVADMRLFPPSRLLGRYSNHNLRYKFSSPYTWQTGEVEAKRERKLTNWAVHLLTVLIVTIKIAIENDSFLLQTQLLSYILLVFFLYNSCLAQFWAVFSI